MSMFEFVLMMAALPFALFTMLMMAYGTLRAGAAVLENLGGIIGFLALLAALYFMLDPHGFWQYAAMIPYWGEFIK